ncbi:MAG: DUF5667 domain-containing protein [Candidatus Gottesmanbacteria bacterium]
MNIKRLLLLTLFFFSISLFAPKTSQAVDLKEVLTSNDSIVVRIQEGIEYFFAFKVENKVKVLERQAEKRLTMAQGYADKGNDEKVNNLLQNYLQIKDRQNDLLGGIKGGEILGTVEERTIEQQKTMEEIKTKIDEDGKKNVVQVQEQVVNQVAKRVIDVNGKEGATEFLNNVVHVWAPGTGPGGGEAGVVYAGGGKLIFAPGTGPGGQGGVVIEGGEMKFAPGTSEGGSGGTDIKNVEVNTGGGSESGGTTVEGGNQNMAPGTTSGGEGTTVIKE